MAVALLRVDDRLIHGQVATAWLSSLGSRRIVVASDSVAKDELRKRVVALTAPKNVEVTILDLEGAVKALTGPLSSETVKVMVLCTTPQEALYLVKAGIGITTVNVGNVGGIGNMQGAKGKKQIFKSIAVGEEDVKAFQEMHDLGVKCDVRGVDIMELIRTKWERR